MKKQTQIIQDLYSRDFSFQKDEQLKYLKYIVKSTITKDNNKLLSNIELIVYRLNIVMNLLRSFVYQDKTILFIGNSDPIVSAITKKIATISRQYYINQKWIGGTLTNRERLFNFEDNNFKLNKYKKLKTYVKGISGLKNDPDLIFIFGIHNNHNAINEAFQLRIPIVGIIDNRENVVYESLNKVTYPINGYNTEVMYLYYKYMVNVINETLREKAKKKLKFLYYNILYFKTIKKKLPKSIKNIVIFEKDLSSNDIEIVSLSKEENNKNLLSNTQLMLSKDYLIKTYINSPIKENKSIGINSKKFDLLDPWGFPFVYKKLSNDNDSYILYSYGNIKGPKGPKNHRLVYIIK